MPSFELLAIIALAILAFGDLIVGVSNDAVNFINSAIGAKASSRKVILTVSAIGILVGATFSDGIMEVARKGIFHPEFFSVNEVIIVFTAVALADIILLDLYSTFGLPTSTTVSVVFELLGAALIMAFLKIGNFDEAWAVINSESAVKIISGIILSIGIAFAIGLAAQFITRLIFTFDYHDKLKKIGFLWSGIALTSLMFFILLKGGEHSSFMTPSVKAMISSNIYQILIVSFVIFSTISYILIRAKINILKIIILIGTGALAMAFAGNDLANFIGVSVAGVSAFLGADLSGKLPTPTWVLLIAGIVMAITLFTSKKARTVTNTEVNLASHGKDVMNHWKSNIFAENLSKLFVLIFSLVKKIVPTRVKKWLSARWEMEHIDNEEKSAFDMIRASVNLIVAAAAISYATSQKLPLSTTYVTFMVAMGTALADGAWNRKCAPHRIAGILTVISGWFITAIIAFAMAGATAYILFLFKTPGLIALAALVIISIRGLYKIHHKRSQKKKPGICAC